MPMRLNVGLSKKIGQPRYGSLGASCHVEVELDHSLLEHDLTAFHDRVRKAFSNCRQAINDELAWQQSSLTLSGSANGQQLTPAKHGQTSDANGTVAIAASASQLHYAEQLAKQIPALGVRRLETLSLQLHAKPLEGLTNVEASDLIDLLRNLKAGRVTLGDVLQDAAA